VSQTAPPLVVERLPDGVAVLKLSNPERRNGLDPSLARALLGTALGLSAHRTARCNPVAVSPRRLGGIGSDGGLKTSGALRSGPG
jgi:hypothetical protein